MNTMELNGAMARKGKSSNDLARAIRKSHVSFNKKRFGEVPFDLNEICGVVTELELDLQQVNEIFFDGNLRDSKFCYILQKNITAE